MKEVQQSFRRCQAQGDFFGVFYGIFLKTSEEIATMFATTDWHKQKHLIQHAIRAAILFAQEPNVPIVRQHMEQIARSHSRTQRNVRPELYHFWLESMVEAVRQCDPHYTPALGEAWKQVLTPAISLITSRYEMIEPV